MRSLINRAVYLLIASAILIASGICASSIVHAETATGGIVSVTGQLQQWHKVTLTLEGPHASEDGSPNPFMDFRMQVRFRHFESGLTYNVPGYFAADGDAANTSADSGNKWRVHLCPDHPGEWSYEVSAREGQGVAISDDLEAGRPVDAVDGLKGTLMISKTDKTGRDLRGKGRLSYVGKRHLQFAGTKEYFLKAGVDAPENLLASQTSVVSMPVRSTTSDAPSKQANLGSSLAMSPATHLIL